MTGQGLRLTLASGDNATAAQAQELLRALYYQNTATGATLTDGARVLTVTALDSSGNLTGTPAIVTLTVNVATPKAATSSPLVTADGNGDGVLGDQFTIKFSELVAVTAVATTSNWTLSGSWTLGTGATITAVNPISINGVTYAQSFLFKSGTCFTYTTSTTLSIGMGMGNVVVTAGGTAANNVVFTMTDFVSPSAPVSPLSIATDNYVNLTERNAGQSLIFGHTTAITGDTLQIFRDGLFVKSVTTSGSSTSVTLTGVGGWGVDGSHSFTAKISYAAGNLSSASPTKFVTVNTVVGTVQSVSVITDLNNNGVADSGGVVRLNFTESVLINTLTLPTSNFCTRYSVGAVGAYGGKSQVWDVTLGSSPTLAASQSITTTVNKITDSAGNTGNTTFTVGADLFSSPGTPVIGNVTSDNVLSSTERSSAQTISISMAANTWGADGERTLTASVQRGAGTEKFSQAERHVYMAADKVHWSSSGVLWFDPDTLLAPGSVRSLSASAGTSTATQSTASATPNSTIMANGRRAISYEGGVYLSFTAPTTTTLSSGSSGYSTFVAVLANSIAGRYASSIGSDTYSIDGGRINPYGMLDGAPQDLFVGGWYLLCLVTTTRGCVQRLGRGWQHLFVWCSSPRRLKSLYKWSGHSSNLLCKWHKDSQCCAAEPHNLERGTWCKLGFWFCANELMDRIAGRHGHHCRFGLGQRRRGQ